MASMIRINNPGLQASRLHLAIQGILLASALTVSSTPHAQTNNDHASVKRSYHIDSGSLSQALRQFATNSGLLFSAEAKLTDGKTTAGLNGEYTVEEGFKKLLAGSGLTYTFTAEDSVSIKAVDAGSDTSTLPAVKVTEKAQYDLDDSYNRTLASTATKTDTAIMDTPVSVQVIPQQILKDQQAIRVEDAVKNVSGVQPVWTSGGIGQDYVIRGFGTNYSRFRNGLRLSSFNTDMANVDQVEVLKGPASMLYGRVEPGGMVNVVTKKPLDEAHYSLQQQFGSYDFYRTVAEATGPLTNDKSVTYRMDFGYTDRNSFRDFISQQQVFVAPALRWKASDKTEFNLSLEYMDRNLPYDTGIPAQGNRVANVPISNNYGQPGKKFNQDPSESVLLDFNWSHAFNDDWKLENGFVGNWATNRYREILVAIYQPELDTGGTNEVRRGSQFEDRTENTFNTYMNLTGKFHTGSVKHNVLIGGDYYTQESKTSGFFGYNAANASNPTYFFPGDFGGGSFAFSRVNLLNPTYPNLDFNAYEYQRKYLPNDFVLNETSWYGFYFQDQMSFFGDKLQILGGGRFDWARLKQGSSNTADDGNRGFTPGTPSFDAIKYAINDENYFSPRVGILYRPWRWLSIYGNRIESFGAQNARSETGAPLKPETAEQYEAGFKTEWFDGRLTTNTAYFHIDKKNVLTLVREGGIFDTVGAARSQGIELDVAGQLTNGLSATAAYAYTDARIINDGEGLTNNTGNRLPNVAEHSANLWLKYAFQQEALRGFNIGVGTYVAGKREGDNLNSYQLPGYVRVDTFAGYRMNLGPTKLTTQINVYNIFDKRYYLAGQPYYANRAWNMPGDPLTVLGSVKLEF